MDTMQLETEAPIQAVATGKPIKCRACGLTHTNRYRHLKECQGKPTPPPPPGLPSLRDIQLQITAGVRQLEEKRESVHRELVALDNEIAQYKKLLIKQ